MMNTQSVLLHVYLHQDNGASIILVSALHMYTNQVNKVHSCIPYNHRYQIGFMVYAFRTLVVASIVSIASCIPSTYTGLTVDLSIVLMSCAGIIYHMLSMVIIYFPAVLDLLCVTIQITVLFALGYSYRLDRWASEGDVIFVISVYAQLVALISLLAIRIAAVCYERSVFRPFDFFCASDSRKEIFSCFLKILLGTTLWSFPFRGEKRVVRWLHTFCAISSLAGLLVFFVYATIINPIHEVGLIPVRTYRTTSTPDTFKLTSSVWSILVAMDDLDSVKLESAINVTMYVELIDPFPCTPLSTSHDSAASDIVVIYCNYPFDYSLPSPTLLVTVNFSALNISSDSIYYSNSRSAAIMVGFTNNTDDVIQNTVPTTLFPNSHLLGGVVMSMRRQFNKPRLAALGILSSLRTFLFADITLTRDLSSFVPRSEDTATLRLFLQEDWSEWSIQEDYMDKSVWNGVAAIGGFWTAIDGIFSFFFGGSLLFALFGIKPLSVFGVVHHFQRNQLRRAWREDFPLILSEGDNYQSQQATGATIPPDNFDRDGSGSRDATTAGTPLTDKSADHESHVHLIQDHTRSGNSRFQERGLVAFLRERLIDLGPIQDDTKVHVEPQGLPQ